MKYIDVVYFRDSHAGAKDMLKEMSIDAKMRKVGSVSEADEVFGLADF